MALLDDMLARMGGVSAPPPGMPQWPGDPTATDQAAAAEEARNVAAQRLRRGTIRQPLPLQGMGPIPYVGNSGPFADPNAAAAAPASPAAAPAAMASQHPAPAPMPNDPTWGAPQPAGGAEQASLKGDDPSLLPANATPTAATTPPPGVEPTQAQGTATSAPAAASPSPMGMLSKLFNPNNAATLLALGSGFAGAPSLGTGMRRAFGAAVPAVAADRANTLKQEGIAAKYSSLVQQLVAKGIPQAQAAQMALGAVYSPDQEKALISKYFETKPLVNIDGTLRHPETGEAVANSGPKIVTIKKDGMDTSVLQYPDGRIERLDPRNLPAAGRPPVHVMRFEEALKLPKGTPFVDPFGMTRVR